MLGIMYMVIHLLSYVFGILTRRDITTSRAPDFCTVYVLFKGKIQSVRPAANRALPPCKTIYEEETIISDLFEEEEEEETIIGDFIFLYYLFLVISYI